MHAQLIVNNSLVQPKILNLPTQSNSQPVSQHFSPSRQLLSSVQKFSGSPGHSKSDPKSGHVPGPGNRF